MAHRKSAKKRIRQNIKANVRNHSIRSTVRTAIKKTRSAALQGNTEEARALLGKAEMIIAAAAKHAYHRNNAARKISRLTRLVAKADQATG